MAVLLEASLTIFLLSWDIVSDVRVVTLLREPDDDEDDDKDDVDDDDDDDDDNAADGDDDDDHATEDDDKVNQRPVLTSHPVFPNCLLNLIRII